jgi:hypothetical protein
LVKLDVIHYFQGEGEVAEEDMHPKKADDTEVPKKAVEGALAVLANDLSDLFGRFALALGHDVFVDLRFLHEGVEHVEDTVGAPDRAALSQHNQLVVGLVLGL